MTLLKRSGGLTVAILFAALAVVVAGALVFDPTAALAASGPLPASLDHLTDGLGGISLFGFTVAELLQKRSRIIKEMDGLAKGEPSDKTRAEFDKLEADLRVLDDDIGRATSAREALRSTAARQAGLSPTEALLAGAAGGMPGSLATNVSGASPVIGGTGDVVRALMRSQSVSEVFAPAGSGDTGAQLSLGRYFRGLVTGDWKGAEAEQRAMSVGSLAGGGYVVPTVLSSTLIDSARNQARVIQAGALTIGMGTSGSMRIARVLTDPAPGWKVENDPMAESGMTFEPIEVKAKTLAVLIKMSSELFRDAVNLESALNNALGVGLGLELDRVALFGSGEGEEPKGLLNTTGVQTLEVDENGHVLSSYDLFSEAVQAIDDVNGQANAVIFSPRTAGTLDRLKDTTDQPLTPPESYRALAKLKTKQVPDTMTHGTAENASCAVLGEWPNLLVCVREDLTIEMTTAAGEAFSRYQVWMRAVLRADIAIARPNKFCVIPGIIPVAAG